MAAREGDPAALVVLGELGWWLALGLSNLALALDPAVMVYGGGLLETVTLVLDKVHAAFDELLEGRIYRPEVKILPAQLGERAGAIGASAGGPGRGPLPGRRGLRAAGAGTVHVGVTLPTFTDDAVALGATKRAEQLGLDGVFVFDHLWPLGSPERPALSAFPVLGAVAAVTTAVHFGPLVARIGLVPDDVLVAELLSLARMAPGRLIAGLGTGDSESRGGEPGIRHPVRSSRRAAHCTAGVRCPPARCRSAGVGGRGRLHHRARGGARCGGEPVGGPARRGGCPPGGTAR